jgi:hypothetical protein
MKNINITKKYALIGQTLLVAAVLFVATPALADPIDVSYGNPIDVSYGNPIDVSYGNPIDVSYGNPIDVSYGNPTYTSPSYATVSSGGFSGGFSSYVSRSYGSAPNFTVSNGGFSGGNSNLAVGNYPSAPTSPISSGGFSGGNVLNNYVPNNTYFPTQTYFPNNQVLAANDTPNLSSVYLSDVPYTGAGDVLRVILFTLALILWSALLAYLILRKRQNGEEVFVSVTNGLEIKKDSFGISNQIASDSLALEDIENYARENKVLLSTSASTKLLKLERLNQINSKDLINKMPKEDWVCIGESDLEKYL